MLDNQDNHQNPGHNLPVKRSQQRIEPLDNSQGTDSAAELIRQKIRELYNQEPGAAAEQASVQGAQPAQLSKHQQFMYSLSTSGMPLAKIQQAWHDYYQQLSDVHKHEVWQEFYQQHGQSHPERASRKHRKPQRPTKSAEHGEQPDQTAAQETSHNSEKPAVEHIQARLRNKISQQSKKQSANLKSLVFGLAVGSFMMVIVLFGFFNERFIAPFITPSTVLSSTPLILDEDSPVGEDPIILIPKINIELPVIYDETSIEEDAVQRALEDGVLHYPITSLPGENGNAVIFGHSSNNILNRGDYKFAFVLLNQLENGDTIMLEKDGVRYVYRVYDKVVVPPTELSVLDPDPDKDAILTLITCDPPGTSINRLAVRAEQISPDPTNNESTQQAAPSERPSELPSDAPSLWQRLTN